MSRSKTHTTRIAPSRWIVRFANRISRSGTVLDLACGGGRHGRIFLAKGHPTTFLDRDCSGVEDLSGDSLAEVISADLESHDSWPLADRRFNCVVVTNYLWRPILPRIISSIAAGGHLLYETFAEGNEAFGRPRRPDFILRSGELLDAVRGHLDVIAYEQCVLQKPSPRIVQHIAARRP